MSAIIIGIALVVMGLLALLGIYLSSAALEDRDATVCPGCSTPYRSHVWDDLWWCRLCGSPYVIHGGESHRPDQDVLRQYLSEAQSQASLGSYLTDRDVADTVRTIDRAIDWMEAREK